MLLSMSFGCRTLRFVPEDEKLLSQYELDLKASGDVKDIQSIKNEVMATLKPKPNGKLLFSRFRLWSYYKGSREKSWIITRFLNKKFGEKPVYLSQVNPERTMALIENRLENNGFFYPKISYSFEQEKQKATVRYQVQVGEPYELASMEYIETGIALDTAIQNALLSSEIKQGMRFQLNQLEDERVRINQFLQKSGFYNFRSDYLLFKIDTNQYETRKFDLYLSIKEETPAEALVPYYINEIRVYPTYEVGAADNDTTEVKGVSFIEREESFKYPLLRQYIVMDPGQRYNQRYHQLTSSRLTNLGNYKYASTRFDILDSLSSDSLGRMDMDIYLSPMTRRSINVEMQAVTKSNNFAGPGLKVNYQNRNLFKGGEILDLGLKFGYETQFASNQENQTQNLESWELAINANLTFPRIFSPIKIRDNSSYTVPKTKLGVSYSMLNRVQYYRLNAIQFDYGFNWRPNRFVTHNITPTYLNFTNTSNITPAFEAILTENPFLDRSFENQFIPGLTYTFRYNQLGNLDTPYRIWVNFGVDMAGNLLNLMTHGFANGNENRFLGRRYSRFSRFDVDFRQYLDLSASSQLVSRVFIGVGIPYGDALSLPYIKQYFSGGPGSLRGFRVRSVGPGTYRPAANERNATFFDQAGDIKIEANVEYRFPIFSYVKGALFGDMGNIWLFNDNTAVPGGQWSSNWYRQLAVNAGLGMRVDVDFLVVRLDLGIPLRKPFLPQGSRWLDSFQPLERDWRRSNMIWNFAIGYPF